MQEKEVVSFEFNIRRKYEVVQMTVIVPACMYWTISYVAFYLRPSATPARSALHALSVRSTHPCGCSIVLARVHRFVRCELAKLRA